MFRINLQAENIQLDMSVDLTDVTEAVKTAIARASELHPKTQIQVIKVVQDDIQTKQK